jgi:DNA-directed RNA polymerase sigma subunit (sigma70/sigma32)
MSRELEVRIGVRIDAALDRIRSKVCLFGLAGKLHIGKASDLLQSPDRLEEYVELLNEDEEAKYLEQLPALIAEAKEQDRACAECWETGLEAEQENDYLLKRECLVRLLLRFQFRPKQYERLVRQADKPFLRDAIEYLNAGQERTPAAIVLERIVRMRLRDFVTLEESIADECRNLDEAREELCTAHQELALRVAWSQPHSDESTVSSALVGLRRAARWYDYKRGYSFEEYAQHWVQEAIDKRRG